MSSENHRKVCKLDSQSLSASILEFMFVLGCLFRPERLPSPLLKLSSGFGWEQVLLPRKECSFGGLGKRVSSENEEGKKRAQPVESSLLNLFLGYEVCFLFLSADSVPHSCSLPWKLRGIFL